MVLALAPAAVFAGLAVLLIIWATFYMFQKPIAQLLSGLPVVGGWVATTVSNAIGALVDWGMQVADSTIGAVIEVVTIPITALIDLGSSAIGALESLEGQISRAIASTADQLNTLSGRLGSAAADASSAIARAAAVATGLAAANVTIAYLRDRAIPDARSQAISTADAHADAAVSAEAQHRAAEISATAAAASSATAAEANARVRGDAVSTAAIAAEALARAQAIAAERVATGQAIDGATRPLAGEIGDILTALGPLTITGLIARTVALEQTLTRTIDECVTPTCNAYGPGSGLLDSLSGYAMLLAAMGMVGLAVRDPEGAAKATAGIVGDLEGAAAGVIGALADVRL